MCSNDPDGCDGNEDDDDVYDDLLAPSSSLLNQQRSIISTTSTTNWLELGQLVQVYGTIECACILDSDMMQQQQRVQQQRQHQRDLNNAQKEYSLSSSTNQQ